MNLNKLEESKKNEIFKENIIEVNRKTKNILDLILLLGSLGFLIVGISSYTNINIIPFLNAKEITFFPQGITMSFYGTLGILLSINQILITYWKIGEGYNEFNKINGKIKIFRNSYPGKDKEINITYPLNEILRSHNILNNKSL